MSAEILRRAAALMRERAEAALREDDWRRGIAKLGRRTPKGQHMDGWHPAVAFAVADWPDWTATFIYGNEEHHAIPQDHPALTVARTYLGEA